MPMPTPDDHVRRVLRWWMNAFVAAGTAWVGGSVPRDERPEPPRTAPPAHAWPNTPGTERWVRREAARGIAELERFLDRQPHG